MTILSFFWFLVAIVGAFIIGFMCGRHDAHKLVLGGEPGADDHHGSGSNH